MALCHPSLPGAQLALLGHNEPQKGTHFFAQHHSQSVESFEAGLWFYNGDLQSLTSIPGSFETEICEQH